MFERILVANRGEIACRIFATCRRLGVGTVAVYAEPDRDARHRFAADHAVPLRGAHAADSYLDIDQLIAAARASGAGAVHPGYGFLSENAAFARRCEAEGIVFIGPSADTIEAMGSKVEAKRLVEAAGVPCVPGYHGDDQDDAALQAAADGIGYPLLIKASAGGGGKGMRVVRAADGFAGALAAARREARAAFGDDRVLLERLVERPRHVEVQVFGDHHGGLVHLFERECSLQRRYQKVIEEAPSPSLDDDQRRRIGAAAVAAARAVDYRNAGTVEFIVGADGAFHFMEMNTRLQVEHPVTELVTGLDLVEWQLRIAAGEPLPAAQDAIGLRGHAFEARVYAENTALDFVPASGRIRRFVTPPGVRVDSGVGDGDPVGMYYDPLLAKLCVHADDRAAAVQALRHALGGSAVFGLTSNLPLLRAVAWHDDFAAARFDTGWIERNLDALRGWAVRPSAGALAAAAASVRARRRTATASARPHDPGSPWREPLRQPLEFSPRGLAEPRWTVPGDGGAAAAAALLDGDELVVMDAAGAWELELRPRFAAAVRGADDEAHPGSPMPGRIVSIQCSVGQSVSPGQPLLVLEAMKMEYTLHARTHGTVARIRHAVGDMVDAEVPLVDIE